MPDMRSRRHPCCRDGEEVNRPGLQVPEPAGQIQDWWAIVTDPDHVHAEIAAMPEVGEMAQQELRPPNDRSAEEIGRHEKHVCSLGVQENES